MLETEYIFDYNNILRKQSICERTYVNLIHDLDRQLPYWMNYNRKKKLKLLLK